MPDLARKRRGGGYSDSGDFAGTRVDYNYWLPIPPDAAAVALVAAWPDQDVAETRLRLDLDAIRAACTAGNTRKHT